MKSLLSISSVICLLASLGTCAVSKLPIQETNSLLLLLIAAVLMVGAAIIEAIDRKR